MDSASRLLLNRLLTQAAYTPQIEYRRRPPAPPILPPPNEPALFSQDIAL